MSQSSKVHDLKARDQAFLTNDMLSCRLKGSEKVPGWCFYAALLDW